MTYKLSQTDARALAEAGYMPLSHYMELCRVNDWAPGLPGPLGSQSEVITPDSFVRVGDAAQVVVKKLAQATGFSEDRDAHGALDACLVQLRKAIKDFPDAVHATCMAKIELNGKVVEVKVGIVIPERTINGQV